MTEDEQTNDQQIKEVSADQIQDQSMSVPEIENQEQEPGAQTVAATESILDKVLESKKVLTSALDPEEVIESLINKTLESREQAVIKQRHGLETEKITLEEIGKKLGVTRERVRQVAQQALKKLADNSRQFKPINMLDARAREILEQSGGLRGEASFLSDFFGGLGSDRRNAYLVFYLENLSEFIQRAPFSKPGWRLVGAPVELHAHLEQLVADHLGRQPMPQPMAAVIQKLSEDIAYQQWRERFKNAWPGTQEHIWEDIVEAYMELSEIVAANPFAEWGPATSPLVRPKRMGDKIYLVLSKNTEPLHFNSITEQINRYQFDQRQAYAPTVHNELILDDRFVLVGRGIYALKEWGYSAGTVADVLSRILLASSDPVPRQDLVKAVLKERQVKEGTILLALTDKARFKKTEDGRYSLV